MSGINHHQTGHHAGHAPVVPPVHSSHSSSLQQTQISIRVITNSVINALHFLGFDFPGAERQHKLTFNLATFTKPNPKAFELVTHFLLSQLDPERAQRSFAQCWPAILKEQQKEFKDILFNWLVELSTKSAATGSSSNTKPTGPTGSASASSWTTTTAYHQSLLQQIKFPIINKSLFLSPGGLKVCELLMDLTMYVLLFRLIKLVEANKTNIRIPPKVSLLPSVLNESKQQTSQHSSGVRLLTAKQLLQFEVQITSIKRMIAASVDDFQSILQDQLRIRARLQQYASEKRKSIATTMERTQELKASLAKKRALAAQMFSTDEADQKQLPTLDTLYERFNQSTVDHYNRAYAEFEQITRDELFSNPASVSNIDQILKVKTDHHVIDGADFSRNVSCENENAAKDQDPNRTLNEKIFKFIYENMDRNEAIRNTKIGDLFDKEDQKLNMVNLVRLFNSVLMLKGDLLYKINVNELNKFHNSKSNPDETMQDSKLLDLDFFNLGTSIASTASHDSISEPASINRQATELKKRLDAYLPKLSERIDSLTKKMTSNVRLSTNEADISTARNEYEKLEIMATNLFNDFVSTSKRPLVDRVKLEEALSQQVESCASPKQSDDLFQPEPAPYFDVDQDEYLGLEEVVKPEKQAPGTSECKEEFLSETAGQDDELLQSSSASGESESLTSTKIVSKKSTSTTLAPSVGYAAAPLSPIGHSDQDQDALPEDEQNESAHNSDLTSSAHSNHSDHTHSSLQIIDFSNDSNMDLI